MTQRIVATLVLSDEVGSADRLQLCEALGELRARVPELTRSHASLHIEGSVGGGDLTWDFAVSGTDALRELTARLDAESWAGIFSAASEAERALLAHAEQIEAWLVEPVATNVPHASLAGIKRTNLVRVLEDAATEAVERWQKEVPTLADRVPAIRNWSLARLRSIGPTTPRVRWTHAWEQEFETLEGLLEDYMASPYHWGHLDAWYDVEMPHCIMDPDLAHLYGRASENVLSWTETST